MAASDPDVTAAKAKLGREAGDPASRYISPSDVQTSIDHMQDGWQADIVDMSLTSLIGNDVVIDDPTQQYLVSVNIENDGTDTSAWPNRWQYAFEQGQGSGTFQPSSWINEYGEIRAASAASSTVAMRAHGHNGDDSTADIFQVRNERGGSVNMLRVARSEAEFQVPLTVPDPTSGSHAATRGYVDAAVASGGAAQPIEDFENGDGDLQPIAAVGAIVEVTGGPVYTAASIEGSLSARIMLGQWIKFDLVKSGNVFTASVKVRVDEPIVSSAIRAMLLVDAQGSWISYLRFSSNGYIEVTDGTTLAQTGPAWSGDTVYRCEAVSAVDGDITWQVFDAGGASLWTFTPITPTDTDPPVTLQLGGSGGPSTANTVWDSVYVDDSGKFILTATDALKAELKAEVAASSDFADFKSRIDGW